jgi:hypothetical protein
MSLLAPKRTPQRVLGAAAIGGEADIDSCNASATIMAWASTAERWKMSAARHWYLWVRCPACRTTTAIDLRKIDRHRNAGITSLIPALSCRSCRPNAPFAELVRLSPTSIADEMHADHARRVLGD